MSDSEDRGVTVNVTSKGQATIPKEIREKLAIGTPGKVRFLETEDGEVVIRPVKPPSDMRGVAEEAGDESATDRLREARKRDRDDLDDAGE